MASKPLQPEPDELRVVLWGKTGVGKSASGNTILGHDSFKTDLSSASVTGKCQKEQRQFDGKYWTIVDTPGVFHTKKSHVEIMNNTLDCITCLSPGPHVLLLVLKAGVFSRQDQEMLKVFQKVFKDAKQYTIVLFTHGDQRTVDDFLNNRTNQYLKDFIEQSSEGYHVFNNEVKDESQVADLHNKIKKMVEKNEGNCYKNEMFEMAVTAFEEVMKSRKEQTTSSLSTEAANEYLQGLVSQGIDQVENVVPNLKDFLDRLYEVAEMLIKL